MNERREELEGRRRVLHAVFCVLALSFKMSGLVCVLMLFFLAYIIIIIIICYNFIIIILSFVNDIVVVVYRIQNIKCLTLQCVSNSY